MTQSNFRQDRRASDRNNRGPVADPKAVRSRERDVRPATPAWKWITERSEVEQACLNILRGATGRYPIFGIQSWVETHRGEDGEEFAALHYFDAKLGDEGQNLCGNLREGFWIGVRELMKDPAKGYKTTDHALLALAFISQPEMQMAIGLYREEEFRKRKEARQREQEAERERSVRAAAAVEKLRAKLRNAESAASTPVKAEDSKPKKEKPAILLEHLKDILTATKGQIEHDDVTIFLTGAPEGGIAVRVKNAPEGHPMSEVARKNIFCDQSVLRYAGDHVDAPTAWEGNAQLRYELRTYLRGELMASGVILTPPTESGHTNGHGSMLGNPDPGKARGAEASSVS